MKRLDAYILKGLLKIFLTAELVGFGLLFVIEFFEKLETFTRSLQALAFGLLSVLYKSPYFINLFLPLCFLLSILVLFMVMARRNEIIALRSSGVSTFSLLRPVFLFSFLLAVVSLLAEEFFIPFSLRHADYVYRVKVKGEQPYVFIKDDEIWVRKGNIVANIELFDGKNDRMAGLTLIEIGRDFSLLRRIDAKEAIWETTGWRLLNAVERRFRDGNVEKRVFEETSGLAGTPPSVFKIVRKGPEEMGIRELRRYIGRLKEGGHDTGRYLVDLYNKVSFPFINLVMVLIGTALGLRYKKTTHISLGIFLGLSAGFVYWVLHSFSLALGYAEIFPALFSSFFSSLLLSLLGTIGILTLRR